MPDFFCSTIRILLRHFSVGKKRTLKEKFTRWGETIVNGFVYFSSKPSNLKTSVKFFHSPSLRVAARAPWKACSQAIIPLPFSLRHRPN